MLVLSALVPNIVFDNGFVAILTDGIDVVAAGPQAASPQDCTDVWMCLEERFGREALDDLHHPGREECWDTLGEEVDMVFIGSDLDKVDFVPLGDFQAGRFQSLFPVLIQNFPSVLDGADDMIEHEILVVTLVDMVTHASSLAETGSAGPGYPGASSEEFF